MELHLLIRTGSKKGLSFKIAPGIKIGRKNVDFIIDEKGVSSHHATIRQKPDGNFFLVDNNSKNGSKINGIREDVIELSPGASFTIGKIEFEVIGKDPKEIRPLSQAPSPKQKVDDSTIDPPEELLIRDIATPEPPDSHLIESLSEAENNLDSAMNDLSKALEINVEYRWNDYLEEFAQQQLPKIKNNPKSIEPLNPAVKLEFLSGLQAETEWTLGYGPRFVGPIETDLTIYEPEAPPRCFEISASKKGPVFKTSHPDLVRLNGKEVKKSVLSDGDEILINATRIRVSLIE